MSSYTVAHYKPHVDKCNESKVPNIVNREFSEQPQYNVVVSDLTYVRVGISWHYICEPGENPDFSYKPGI